MTTSFLVKAEQSSYSLLRDDVIKWKHFPRYWPFVRGIHRSPVNSPHKGQWRGALMFSLMCARINSWVNNREAGDLRRYRHHYDVIVMPWANMSTLQLCAQIGNPPIVFPTIFSLGEHLRNHVWYRKILHYTNSARSTKQSTLECVLCIWGVKWISRIPAISKA